MGLFKNIKDRYKEQRLALKQGKYARKQIRAKERAEYYRAKEDQSLRVARESQNTS